MHATSGHVQAGRYLCRRAQYRCSTLQVQCLDLRTVSRNLHQPQRLPLNSFSATRLLGCGYHLCLQHIACCYSLQLQGVRRRQNSKNAANCKSRARHTLQYERAQHTVIASLSQAMPSIVRGTYFQRVLARLYRLQDAPALRSLLHTTLVSTICTHSLCTRPPRAALQTV